MHLITCLIFQIMLQLKNQSSASQTHKNKKCFATLNILISCWKIKKEGIKMVHSEEYAYFHKWEDKGVVFLIWCMEMRGPCATYFTSRRLLQNPTTGRKKKCPKKREKDPFPEDSRHFTIVIVYYISCGQFSFRIIYI